MTRLTPLWTRLPAAVEAQDARRWTDAARERGGAWRVLWGECVQLWKDVVKCEK